MHTDSPLASLRLASLVLFVGVLACTDDTPATDTATDTIATEGDGDGDGDGDGEPGDGDGDGEPGDGDGDGEPGDGDGDGEPGDGDGDGDGDPICGDGIVEEGIEECDDGNDDNTDTCVEGCLNATCGDGYVGPGEGCDDGNQVDDDACNNACALTSCGDGIVQQGEACDDGDADNTDDCLETCAAASCGDGFAWAGNEACDDGNMVDGDACQNDCTLGNVAIKIVRGYWFTCVLTEGGQVKCWGENDEGQLGRGNTIAIGDNELPSSIGFIDLGGTAVDIEAGGYHVCAIMADASLKCWGHNQDGQLGYGNTSWIGDNELPSSVGAVDLGGDGVVALALGQFHTCALTDQQTVRCWGFNLYGQLGRSSTANIGDNELPSSVGPVSLGGAVVDIAAGLHHTCARLVGGGVKCWGRNHYGQLGLGHTNHIGDNELPSAVGNVSLGNTPVVDVVAGQVHSCALYQDGTVRCWGRAFEGQLGRGNTTQIGDNETPSSVPTINVGAPVDELIAAYDNTCVRAGTQIKCWGYGGDGINGYGHINTLGDNEVPSSYGMVDVGFDVTALTPGGTANHVCVLSGSALRCWGLNLHGQLGYGNTNELGDNELPSSVGEVPYL